MSYKIIEGYTQILCTRKLYQYLVTNKMYTNAYFSDKIEMEYMQRKLKDHEHI